MSIMPIRVDGERLVEVKYKVLCCPAAIACCSMMSELATGKTVVFAASALRSTIDDFVFGRPRQSRKSGVERW
jgi:NifU-like protein involved in Fe-S cluster formation